MRLLVTGAAGFIGSHLTTALVAGGHTVTVVDNFSHYYSPELKELRVEELLKPIGQKLIIANLNDFEDVRKIFEGHEFDAVIHLSAQPGVRVPTSGYDRYIRDNIVAFNNVFQLCLTNRVKSFLYASSSSVYGNRSSELLSENDTDLNPVSYYGATKLANELLAKAGVLNSETSAIGMRFFTVYGPYGRPDMAYFRLLANIMNGYEFEMFGDGSVLRDFTFISDTVDAIVSLLDNSYIMKAGSHEIFNIGGGKPASLNQMISIISSNFSNSPKIEMRMAHPGDVRSTNANTNKLHQTIGFKPEVTLEDGIQEVINWAKRPSVVTNLKAWAESVN